MKKLTQLFLFGGFALMSVSSQSVFASWQDGPPSLPEITVTGQPDSAPTPPPYTGGPSSGPPPSGPYRPSPLTPQTLDINTLSPSDKASVLFCRAVPYHPLCTDWYSKEICATRWVDGVPCGH